MEHLLNAINSVADDDTALPATKVFLADESQRRMFAEKINADSGKAAFLSIQGLTAEVYDNLRNILNAKKIDATNTKIVAKRGRAGGLRLISAEIAERPSVLEGDIQSVQTKAEEVDQQELKLEKEYYPLVKVWAIEAGYDNCEITGGKLPGFKWENPDLIAVNYVVSKITRAATFDVASFEVKLRVEPYAVWQAAHYKRFSSEVYVAFAKDEKAIREQNNGRIFELAVELSLGVLAYDSINGRFKEIQSPKRQTPEDAKVNETLDNFKNLPGVGGVLEKAVRDMNALIGDVFASAWRNN